MRTARRIDFLPLLATILRLSAWPDWHEVPSATAWEADQLPLAHLWKCVPSMQFHWPSVGQAVPALKPPLGLDPELALEPELGAGGRAAAEVAGDGAA